MSTPLPIAGNSYVCVGYATLLICGTPGGSWSSSDTTIATVDSNGNVTGIKLGAVTISYTISGTSTLTMNVVPLQTSNGFNLARVYSSLTGRIGWKQPTIANSPVLDSRNLTATGGRYWNQGHKLVTINNLKSSQEDTAISDFDFNQFLQDMDNSVTMRCLTGVFSTAMTPTFIEHRLCYVRRNYNQMVIIPHTPSGAFCGYRIQVAEGNIAVVFNAISLYFNQVATFNIYLFNDLIAAPLMIQSVTTVANSQTKVNLNWAVNYIQQNNNGGIWYIGYFDTEIGTAQAVDEQLNLWENSICWNGVPFTSTKVSGQLDFNRRYVGTTFYSYGLNVEMSSYRDYTQVIVQNAHLFDEARILAYSVEAIDLIANSTSEGAKSRVLQELVKKAQDDLDRAFPTKDLPYVAGLKYQLDRELKQIQQAFTPKIEAKSFTIIGGNSDGVYDQYQGFDIDNLPIRQTLT